MGAIKVYSVFLAERDRVWAERFCVLAPGGRVCGVGDGCLPRKIRVDIIGVEPFPFEWVDETQTEMDYGAMLTRLVRKYDVRF